MPPQGKQRGEISYVLRVYLLLLIFYHWIYGAFFPTHQGTIGHDYSLSLPSLVDGFIWFAKNGLWAVPWFTPGFCGGQPFFADPQSGYYAVPQWLTFITDPLSANYLTLLLFSSAGYFGTYLLARRSFGLAPAWAILAAALYFFNGFLPHRMIVGHTGYHALSMAPWLAYALLVPAASRVSTIGLGVLAGTIAAYWLQSGLTTLMVPAALGIALVLLVYRLRQPWTKDLQVRVLIAIGISVAFSASKLVASLSFYSHFERTQYLLPGFENPLALIGANLIALFGPSQSAYAIGDLWLVNIQWLLLPHEWAYSFTFVPILILTRASALARGKGGQSVPGEPIATGGSGRIGRGATLAVMLAIATISLIPLAVQFYTPGLNAWYKGMPLIGATASPMRWLIMYLPALPIATALLARRILGDYQDESSRLVAGVIIVLILLNLIEPRRYYAEQSYRPEAILAGYARLAAGEARDHRVHTIGVKTNAGTGQALSDAEGNDIVADGVSQARCYNPAFGYRLEKLPPGSLQLGGVLVERNGTLNIRNPACYVFPEENDCKPGDSFRSDQRVEAEAFVSYAPFPFKKSRLQRVADLVTMGGLLAALAFVSLVWPCSAWRGRRLLIRSTSAEGANSSPRPRMGPTRKTQ